MKIALIAALLITPAVGLAGPIEDALGSNATVVHKTLESLSAHNINSPHLDSFTRAVESLSSAPNLETLPSVNLGDHTVHLERLRPFVELAKSFTPDPARVSPATSSVLNSFSTGWSTSLPVTFPASTQSPFSSLHSSLQSAPLPDRLKNDLSKLFNTLSDFSRNR